MKLEICFGKQVYADSEVSDERSISFLFIS